MGLLSDAVKDPDAFPLSSPSTDELHYKAGSSSGEQVVASSSLLLASSHTFREGDMSPLRKVRKLLSDLVHS